MQKLDVAVLGATGAVGQRFVQLLENHPWFRVAEVIGSERSAGKTYGEAAHWILDGAPPEHIAGLTVKGLDDTLSSSLVFSALPKEAAEQREIALASAGYIVCTNASTNRMVDDVPLLLPEVNADHLRLIDVQRRNRGWAEGALVANSNCTTMPVVMALKPLMGYGVEKVHMVSAQATSGAGYPGVSSLDILDNVVPYVPGDEHKMESETLKMLGHMQDTGIQWLDAVTGATCMRVPVIDGHLVHVSVSLAQKPEIADLVATWEGFQPPHLVANLPSSPVKAIQYLHQTDRPQPRRDRDAGAGMTASIGRARVCPLLGYKFVVLAHNTIRGAAGCSILNAELMAVEGYIKGFNPAQITQPAGM